LKKKQLDLYNTEAGTKRNRKSDTLQAILVELFTPYLQIKKASTPNSVMFAIFKLAIHDDIPEKDLKLLTNVCFKVLKATIISTSFEAHMTKYRNLSQELFGYPSRKDTIVKSIFKLTEKQFTDKVAAQKNSRITKLRNLIPISSTDVMKYMTNPPLVDVMDKIIYVQLNTGSRFIEVLDKTATEYKVDPTDPRNIIIDGTAKSILKKRITRPLLIGDATDIIKIVNDIRLAIAVSTRGMNRQSMTAKFNSKINDRIVSITWIPDTFSSSHILRKIYANMAYDLFSPKSVDRTVYVGDILGHDQGSFETSMSYTNVRIVV
jgi:hypothetical protein